MLEGKRRDGKDISPSYLEDPYFDSVEDAVGYSDWKDEITPNPKRKRGVPNLYIDGTYHRSIWIEVTQTSINFKSYFQGANDIERKFTDQIYGLNKDMRTIYIEQRLRKEFMELIRKQLSRNK